MEHSYTGMPQQRSLRKQMVPAAGRCNNHLLPLGSGTSDGSAEKRNTAINDRAFAELPAPKQVSRNVAERCATLHIGNASLDIYPGCDAEQLKMLVELLCLC